ncbi:GPR1/FUN34/YaaH family transporter [Streptomyces sp. NPDC051133]|uniref:GPR1/FUN34/YaaH family transporter n=1 Tax=Streptomyces sp. NPDC051133 TaxID=3155521 RepID=UPI003430BA7B
MARQREPPYTDASTALQAGSGNWVLPCSPAPAHGHQATGLFSLTWTIFTIYMSIVTARLNGVLLALLTALLVTFMLPTGPRTGPADPTVAGRRLSGGCSRR